MPLMAACLGAADSATAFPGHSSTYPKITQLPLQQLPDAVWAVLTSCAHRHYGHLCRALRIGHDAGASNGGGGNFGGNWKSRIV